jgi:hypothetical protein
MSLAAGDGDHFLVCLGEADDKLSVSLAADGGGGDRFSFLTDREYHSELYCRTWGCLSVSYSGC